MDTKKYSSLNRYSSTSLLVGWLVSCRGNGELSNKFPELIEIFILKIYNLIKYETGKRKE